MTTKLLLFFACLKLSLKINSNQTDLNHNELVPFFVNHSNELFLKTSHQSLPDANKLFLPVEAQPCQELPQISMENSLFLVGMTCIGIVTCGITITRMSSDLKVTGQKIAEKIYPPVAFTMGAASFVLAAYICSQTAWGVSLCDWSTGVATAIPLSYFASGLCSPRTSEEIKNDRKKRLHEIVSLLDQSVNKA